MDAPREQGLNPEAALVTIKECGPDAPWALAWLAAYDFAHNPDDAELHKKNIASLSVHIIGEEGPEAQELAQRATLAGTMNVTYGLLGREALHAVQTGETDVYFGPSRCNIFYMPDGSGMPLTQIYRDGSSQDMFMRAIMMLADKAEHVRATFPQYEPVWSLEQGIRQAIRARAKPYVIADKQYAIDLPTDPLSKERILQAGSMFWRNVMHGLLIVGDRLEPPEIAAATAHNSIEAFKAAAAFPKAKQRQAMGVFTATGTNKKSPTPPEIIENMQGQPRFRGLTYSPRKPSLCTGRGVYEGFGDWPLEDSAIATLVDLGALVARRTIWIDEERKPLFWYI